MKKSKYVNSKKIHKLFRTKDKKNSTGEEKQGRERPSKLERKVSVMKFEKKKIKKINFN